MKAKRMLALLLAASMVLPQLTTAQTVHAAETKAKINDSIISIENDYLKREFEIENGHVLTSAVVNKRIDKTLIPGEGSEDFIINTLNPDFVEDDKEDENVPEWLPGEAYDTSEWSASLKNGEGNAFADKEVKKLFDDNKDTYVDNYQISGHPFTLDIDFGKPLEISGMSVDKRPGYKEEAYGINGTMGGYEIWAKETADAEYSKICEGEFEEKDYHLHQANGLYNVGDTVYTGFETVTAQYVRVVQTSAGIGTVQEFTSSEIDFYQKMEKNEAYAPENPDDTENARTKAILSSELVYAGAEADNSVEGEKKVTISYEPYVANNVTYTIKQVVVLKDDDHYMRSFLEISVDNPERAQIDYIDTDRFVLPADAEGVWCHPEDKYISSMWIGAHELMLGQPIFVDGMFMGSEFPATDTIIKDNETQIRYYSGKTFTRLGKDRQLTADGKYVTWQNVIGAARGTENAVVQTDFFEYIEEIATPTEFRKQYNSWYDNMMSITDASIASSFIGAEKGLAENGVEPLDAYVVDDGWNNYYDGEFTKPSQNAGSGTPNRTGFWEFNDKFPNELYTSSLLAQKLGSSFGVWVGPQGGYSYYKTFAEFMESKGTGEVQPNSALGKVVCTGSRKYLKNFETMAIDYQNRFNVDYWKWDGFASRPCNSPEHDHMAGGENNMYFTSDMWEAWTDLFENVRKARAEQGKGLFINATCYINLSPWLLQWVNTIWVQDSGDTGQLGTGERHQQKIYYRDQVYYQLYKQNQVQFPLKNIYNHDPIYGVSDGSKATTEVFREFLFANAVRGTAFWELYYSPSIMDDAKWKVTADALAWAEDNHEVLKNAKLFGDQPKKGVYGYSSWNGAEGVLSFTNPLDEAREYTLKIDGTAGASEAVRNLKGIQVHPYKEGELEGTLSYGDSVKVSLKPHETIIYQYGHTDEKAPELVSAKMTGEKEVTLRFDERIQNSEFAVNGETAAAELKEDYRTVVLTTKNKLQKDAQVTYSAVDFNGNKAEGKAEASYSENGVLAAVSDEKALKNAPALGKHYDAVSDTMWLSGWDNTYTVDTAGKLKGTEDFGISLKIQTESSDVNLFDSNNGEVRLTINKDGFVEFKVKDAVISSKEEMTTVTEKAHGTFGTEEYVPTATETVVVGQINDGKSHAIAASREANGMLKLYIDGKLAAALYDKEHMNEKLQGGEMKVLDAGLKGRVAQLEVRNKAVGADAAEAINETVADFVSPSREGWTATACSEMPGMGSDACAMAAIDGSESSWWHTNYTGEDTCTEPHWIAVDFHKAETFDKFIYVGRGASSNGSIKDYRLELMDENGEYTVIKEGSFAKETAENIVQLDREYTAYGLRLTALSTQNGRNYAAAVEISVANPDRELEEAELKENVNALIAKVGSLGNYTAESVKAFLPIYEEVKHVERASVLTWTQMEKEFNEAFENLAVKKQYTAYVDGEDVITGAYNTKVALHAAAEKDGNAFICWMAGDSAGGKKTVVSMNKDYTFYLANDVYLTAVYEEGMKAEATASLVNTIAMPAESGKIDARFVAQLALPEGAKLLDAGLVWSSKEEPAELTLNADGVKVTHITKINTAYQFSVTIKGVPAGRYVRGVVFAQVQLPDGTKAYKAADVIYSGEGKIMNQ